MSMVQTKKHSTIVVVVVARENGAEKESPNNKRVVVVDQWEKRLREMKSNQPVQDVCRPVTGLFSTEFIQQTCSMKHHNQWT